MEFKLVLVLEYEIWKYVRPLISATYDIFLDYKGLKLTQGRFSSWMKEK